MSLKIFKWKKKEKGSYQDEKNEQVAVKWFKEIQGHEEEVDETLTITASNGYAELPRDRYRLILHNNYCATIKFNDSGRIFMFGRKDLGWIPFAFYPSKKSNGLYKKHKNTLIDKFAEMHSKIPPFFSHLRISDLEQVLPPPPPTVTATVVTSTAATVSISMPIPSSSTPNPYGSPTEYKRGRREFYVNLYINFCKNPFSVVFTQTFAKTE